MSSKHAPGSTETRIDRAANARNAIKQADAEWWWEDGTPPRSCAQALRDLRGVTAEDLPNVRDVRDALLHAREYPVPTITTVLTAARLRAAGFPFSADLGIADSREYVCEAGPLGVLCEAFDDARPYRHSNGSAVETERNRRADIVRGAIIAAGKA